VTLIGVEEERRTYGDEEGEGALLMFRVFVSDQIASRYHVNNCT